MDGQQRVSMGRQRSELEDTCRHATMHTYTKCTEAGPESHRPASQGPRGTPSDSSDEVPDGSTVAWEAFASGSYGVET